MSSDDVHTPNSSGGFEVVEAPIMDSDSPSAKTVAAAAPPDVSAVPDISEAADFATDVPEAATATTADAASAEPPAQEPEPRTRGLYFVRIPRPNVDDRQVKDLQKEFQGGVARVRELNEKLQIKRGERNELRKQISLAKSLRDGSQPEYEEKLARLTELRNLRKTSVNEMRDIKTSLRGLEVKTEAELDERIGELESRIAYGQVELREEKQIVQNISKLRQQRERVRLYESQNSSRLGELEGENSKVKAVIAELESEFNILKGEREQAIKIIQELRGKLDVVDAAYKVLEEEQSDAVAEKNRLLEALNKARVDTDAAMKEFRDNRKFSLLIRDMVAAHQLDQARALCEEQVETWVCKINDDAAFRKDYVALWSEQRKYVVSELLPNSAPAEVRNAEPRQGGGGQSRPSARGPPSKPQGKLKAEEIIAAALEQANRELASIAVVRSDTVSEEAEEDSEPEPIVVPAPVAKKSGGGGDSVFKHKAELPAVLLEPEEEFVVPVAARAQPQLSAEEQKATVRAENQRKAAEAEARKKRRQEATDRKRSRAAEAAQRRAEELKVRAAASNAAAAFSSAAEDSEAKVTDLSAAENTAEDTDTGAEVVVAQPVVTSRKTAAKQRPAEKRPAEKVRLPRPSKKDKLLKAKNAWYTHPAFVFAVVMAILIIVIGLALRTK